MSKTFFMMSSQTDPASLAVNKKELLASRLPPLVKKAQGDLILEIKAALIKYEKVEDSSWLDGTSGSIYEVFLEFGFRSDLSDIDGPTKRVLDALERALQAREYNWNDRMVYDLHISKYLSPKPNLTLKVERMY